LRGIENDLCPYAAQDFDGTLAHLGKKLIAQTGDEKRDTRFGNGHRDAKIFGMGRALVVFTN